MPAKAFPAAVTLLNQQNGPQRTMFGYGTGSVQQRSSWYVLVPPPQKKGLRRWCTAFAAPVATSGGMVHAWGAWKKQWNPTSSWHRHLGHLESIAWPLGCIPHHPLWGSCKDLRSIQKGFCLQDEQFPQKMLPLSWPSQFSKQRFSRIYTNWSSYMVLIQKMATLIEYRSILFQNVPNVSQWYSQNTSVVIVVQKTLKWWLFLICIHVLRNNKDLNMPESPKIWAQVPMRNLCQLHWAKPKRWGLMQWTRSANVNEEDMDPSREIRTWLQSLDFAYVKFMTLLQIATSFMWSIQCNP